MEELARHAAEAVYHSHFAVTLREKASEEIKKQILHGDGQVKYFWSEQEKQQ